MKLPELKEADKYVGLYVVDFGDHSSTGFTEREVAELLESEQCADAQVYKILRAQPDGRMELKGVPRQIFQLEARLFFDAADEATAREDYARLLDGGCVEGGVGVVEAYYDRQPTILEREQLWPADAVDGLAGEKLMAAAGKTFAR